jgi:hypothetical protein
MIIDSPPKKTNLFPPEYRKIYYFMPERKRLCHEIYDVTYHSKQCYFSGSLILYPVHILASSSRSKRRMRNGGPQVADIVHCSISDDRLMASLLVIDIIYKN